MRKTGYINSHLHRVNSVSIYQGPFPALAISLALGLFTLLSGFATEVSARQINLLPDGTIPVWHVGGPFDQPHEGFGTPKDFDPVDEATLEPVWNENWFPQTVNSDGFLDFNDILGWDVNTDEPEKIWMARAAYATASINSDSGGEATLYFGGNSRIKIVLNGEEIFQSGVNENAVKDARSARITLKVGENLLTIRTTQSHQNFNIVIFDELRYDWGFYARIEAAGQNLNLNLPDPPRIGVPSLSVTSTIFYKNVDGSLHQRHDVYVKNDVFLDASESMEVHGELGRSTLAATSEKGAHQFDLGEIPYGVSRHEIWLPEIQSAQKAEFTLRSGGQSIGAGDGFGTGTGTIATVAAELVPKQKYELHLMFLSHTDIGYTHTQPVVREIHLKILDDVIALCERDPDFKWTIETVWMLDVYYQGRTAGQFKKLNNLIHEGRIAVSPFYTNPFTGMVSEEEMIRSFDKAHYFAEAYGIPFEAAIYNDVPGQTWFVPRMLGDLNITFYVNGLNEVYSGYRLQQAIPKVMQWQGDDGSRVIHYRTESYNEAMAYGLERDNVAVSHRMWQRIAKLEADDYPFDIILLNSAFGDNLGIPERQWEAHKTWNREYEWPKFVPATITDFAKAVEKRTTGLQPADLPLVKGDAISDWDVFYQGEPYRMQRYRQSQHHLFAAENLTAVTALQNPKISTMRSAIDRAYDLQLHYSGHGSGLEYGYGSDQENERTFDYRESYVSEASMAARKTLERSSYRTMNQDAALEGEYAVVINPHSFPVSTNVELGLKPVWGEYYEVEDAATGACMPSVVADHVLKFTVRDLPALGWKKFRLVAACSPQPASIQSSVSDTAGNSVQGSPSSASTTSTSISTSALASTSASASTSPVMFSGPDFIENDEYRIQANPETGTIKSVFDKKNHTELLRDGTGFAVPTLQTGGPDEAFEVINRGPVRIEIVDESPVAFHMNLIDESENALYPTIQLTLANGKPGIAVTVHLDLTRFESTTIPGAYAVSFPRVSNEQQFEVETVGGFLNGRTDRMPGMETSAFSMRRVLGSGSITHSLYIASPDARVVFSTDDAVHFNLANNFPDSWNRREPNDRVLTSRFFLMTDSGPFHPGRAARFGWVSAVSPEAVRGWFTHEPAEFGDTVLESEFSVLQALRPLGDSIGDGLLIRLRNTSKHRFDTVSIKAPWISGGSISKTDFTGGRGGKLNTSGGRVEIRMKPNETVTLKWQPEQQPNP